MAQSRGSSDRRRSQRFGLGIDVAVELGESRQRLVSANISAGGMKLRSRDPAALIELDPGQIVKLEFNLPLLSAPVVVDGEVRWVDADTCGIQFVELSPRVVSAINRLQWRR